MFASNYSEENAVFYSKIYGIPFINLIIDNQGSEGASYSGLQLTFVSFINCQFLEEKAGFKGLF